MAARSEAAWGAKTRVLTAQYIVARTQTRSASRRPARRQTIQITARDRQILAFAAEHRFVLAAHIRALLGASGDAATRRLYALRTAGFVSGEPLFHRQPSYFQITHRGLAVIGSDLPRPRSPDLRQYRHDVGVAWLLLAARAGTFGQLREVVSERAMRSRDGVRGRAAPPLAVRLGGYGAAGNERFHYPDLLLHTTRGNRIAIELELTGKGRGRRETILAGYAGDARIDGVVYFVDRDRVGRAIQVSASRLGISSLVRVRRCAWGSGADEPARAVAPQRVAAARPDLQLGR